MAMFGDWPEAKLLLSQANIQVNLQDKNGETALMFATYCRGIGYKEIVEALLQRSDIDATLVDKVGFARNNLFIDAGITKVSWNNDAAEKTYWYGSRDVIETPCAY